LRTRLKEGWVEETESIKISARWVSRIKFIREGWRVMNMTQKLK